MQESTEPKLSAPGAGLPLPELLIARGMVKWNRLIGSTQTFDRAFDTQREVIRSLIAHCTAESGATRVLIKRPLGLEDSSRYWSAWMTLDHLRIVNEGISAIYRALDAGIVPPRSTSTADVKPSLKVGPEIVAAYEKSCDDWVATRESGRQEASKVRYAHPWFGPLDTIGWRFMIGTHLAIHRTQIERILQRP